MNQISRKKFGCQRVNKWQLKHFSFGLTDIMTSQCSLAPSKYPYVPTYKFVQRDKIALDWWL